MDRRIYGYVRISTPKQNIDRQVRNIKKIYPDAIIIKEIQTIGCYFEKETHLILCISYSLVALCKQKIICNSYKDFKENLLM